MIEIDRKWYVLRTVGGKENKVKEYIDSEISNLGLQEYVSQVLIPTEKVFQVRNGKKISKERIFLPEDKLEKDEKNFFEVLVHHDEP